MRDGGGEMFAIGFVPDGKDFEALFSRLQALAQLGFGLVRETVCHAERIFSERKHVFFAMGHIPAGNLGSDRAPGLKFRNCPTVVPNVPWAGTIRHDGHTVVGKKVRRED